MKIYNLRGLIALLLLIIVISIFVVCGFVRDDVEVTKLYNRDAMDSAVISTIAYIKNNGNIPIDLSMVKDDSGNAVSTYVYLDAQWPHWNPVDWYEKYILLCDRKGGRISLEVIRKPSGTPEKLVLLPPFPDKKNCWHVYTVALPEPPYHDKEIRYTLEKVPNREFFSRYKQMLEKSE